MAAFGSGHRDAWRLLGGIASLLVWASLVANAPADLQLQYAFVQGVDDPTKPGGINDLSGNGHNGTAIDPSLASFVAGPSGNMNAIHFNKDDNPTGGSGIDTGTDTTTVGVSPGPFTVMAWVNVDNLTGDNMVFGTTQSPALHLGFRSMDIYMGFWSNDSSAPYQAPPVGEWHHVAWRYDPGTTMQDILLDGVLLNSSGNHTPYGQNQELLIGRTIPNNGAYGGALSDVRVYNQALSDDAVNAIAMSPP
jgi:hypothetical protein